MNLFVLVAQVSVWNMRSPDSDVKTELMHEAFMMRWSFGDSLLKSASKMSEGKLERCLDEMWMCTWCVEQCGTMRNKSEETKNTAHHQGPQGCSAIINCVLFFCCFFIADVRKLPPIGTIRMKSKVLVAVVTQRWTSENYSDSGPSSFALRWQMLDAAREEKTSSRKKRHNMQSL